MAIEGNLNHANFDDYDLWFLKQTKSFQTTIKNARKLPDCMGTFTLHNKDYEFLYLECVGLPFDCKTTKIEKDRRKIIRYLHRNYESRIRKFNSEFPSIFDEHIVDKLNKIPLLGFLVYGDYQLYFSNIFIINL